MYVHTVLYILYLTLYTYIYIYYIAYYGHPCLVAAVTQAIYVNARKTSGSYWCSVRKKKNI